MNVKATLRAIEFCAEQFDFADCMFFTNALVMTRHPRIRVVPIEQIGSSAGYSDFLLTKLVDHVKTSHCLIVQWDGHILDASRWSANFLDYDYIGASWPQFRDGHDVGNGGFSLRSRRLMDACRSAGFIRIHPEDMAIGRTNRNWLEAQGIRFAPRNLADLFSAERSGDLKTAFGYHGVWNMPQALGVDMFWKIYCELDDLGSVRTDFSDIIRYVSRGTGGMSRATRMIMDRVRYM